MGIEIQEGHCQKKLVRGRTRDFERKTNMYRLQYMEESISKENYEEELEWDQRGVQKGEEPQEIFLKDAERLLFIIRP